MAFFLFFRSSDCNDAVHPSGFQGDLANQNFVSLRVQKSPRRASQQTKMWSSGWKSPGAEKQSGSGNGTINASEFSRRSHGLEPQMIGCRF